MSVVSVRDLRKEYGALTAVDGISFEIGEGEVYALLGENGAGKSTTVEILEGHRKRTSGDVTVLGADPGTATRDFRDRIGIVLQTSGVEHELTVREAVDDLRLVATASAGRSTEVDRAGRPRRRSSTSASARCRAASAGGSTSPSGSSAARRCCSSTSRPPASIRPPAARPGSSCAPLCSGGTTVLLTTHYLDEAEHLADRVGVLAAGRLVAEGTPEELIGGPARRSCASTCPPGTTAADLAGVRAGRGGGRRRPGRVHDDDADVGRPRRHRLGAGAGHRADRARRDPAVAGGRVPAARRRAGRGGRRDDGFPSPPRPAGPPRRATRCGCSLRTPIAVFFVILLPLIMLVLFNALFGGNTVDTGSGEWPLSQFYTGALAAFTAVSATFTNLANTVPIRRDEGVLKRWRGTPERPWVVLGGMIGSSIVLAAVGVDRDARARRRRLRPRHRRGQGAGGDRHVPRRRGLVRGHGHGGRRAVPERRRRPRRWPT